MRKTTSDKSKRYRAWLCALRDWWSRSRPFLASAAIHILLLVILRQLVSPTTSEEQPFGPLNVDLISRIEKVSLEDKSESPSPTPEAKAVPTVVERVPELDPGLVSPESDEPVIVVPSKAEHRMSQARSAELRAKHVAENGGTEASESSVQAALIWLSKHQSPDGGWDAAHFAVHSADAFVGTPDDIGEGIDDPRINPGVSGLALLAFLGAGNTHLNGQFQETVRRGIDYILSLQQGNGKFTASLTGGDPYEMYNQAICTIVLGEACTMTHDGLLRPPIEKAIAFIAGAQQDGGGWDYNSSTVTKRNDTSVTGWVVMALKSAYSADIDIPWIVLFNTMRHFETVTQQDGQVVYCNKGIGMGRKGLGMVAVGMTCRQLLGWAIDSRVLQMQAKIISRYPPNWERVASGDMYSPLIESSYYWYYGTLAMRQMGGKYWKNWNDAMRDMLILHQVRDGSMRGSWDPVGRWANAGGRIYSTAINALNLEVYYRYLPLYESDTLDGAEVLATAARSPSSTQRLLAYRMLRDFDDAGSIALLAQGLYDADEELRIVAAESLVLQENRIALPTLIALTDNSVDFARFQSLKLLRNFNLKSLTPLYLRLLGDGESHVRDEAADRLTHFAGDSFGYVPNGSLEENAEAQEQFRLWWRELADGSREFAFEGKVEAVDESRGHVYLDIGRNQGVSERDGFFAVMRREKYVALLSVREVYSDSTLATVLTEYSPDAVKKGDTAIPSVWDE